MIRVKSQSVPSAIPFIVALFVLSPVGALSENVRPVADAGLPRYAALDQVVLDGTGSYDPDVSGRLSSTWRQVSGPLLVIADPNTATPAISGFVQTHEIQKCEFELLVGDGELTSLSDAVEFLIVPHLSESKVVLQNHPFDPHKPTVIFFDGGGTNWPKLTTGGGHWPYYAGSSNATWQQRTNVISFYPYVADDENSVMANAT